MYYITELYVGELGLPTIWPIEIIDMYLIILSTSFNYLQTNIVGTYLTDIS
jgi:hypothetical protein